MATSLQHRSHIRYAGFFGPKVELNEVEKIESQSSFTLRFMLALVAVVAVAIATFRNFGSLGVAVLLLVIGLLLLRLNLSPKQSSKVCSLLIVPPFVWCCCCILGWAFFGYGPIVERRSWPYQLNRMVDLLDADVDSVRVSGLGKFIDSEYVWRIETKEPSIGNLVGISNLDYVTQETIPSEFWGVFPGWWRPSPSSNLRYLASPNFPSKERGQDGEHFVMVYNPKSSLLYVWYKNNF